MNSKKKKILVASSFIALLILSAAVITIYHFAKINAQEAALPPEDRIKRNFSKSFNPEESTLTRIENIRRLFSNTQQIPKEKRQAVMVEALTDTINQTLQNFAALPPELKEDRAKLMMKDAEQTYAYFRRIPREKQEKAISILMNDKDSRAAFDNAINTAANVLSPKDRELLNPTFKTWKKILERR